MQENFEEKYTKTGALGKKLIENFYAQVFSIAPSSKSLKVLEVGCGHGFSTERICQHYPHSSVHAIDIDLNLVRDTKKRAPNAIVTQASIYDIPFESNHFDIVFCLEVLEHIEYPVKGLKELSRVSKGDVITSVPREPIWRALNVARLKYLSSLGNTPGHINHWSTKSFINMVNCIGTVIKVKTPLPWTITLWNKNK